MKPFIVLFALCLLLSTVQSRDLQQSLTKTDNTLAEVFATTPSLSTLNTAVQVSSREMSNSLK
jgi:hypothetical protein